MKKSHIRLWPRKDDRKDRDEIQRAKRRDRLDTMMVVATITSSIATTAAVVVGVYQYSVARDQLVAADRNRSIQTMAEHARALCMMLEETTLARQIVSRPSRKEPSEPSDHDAMVLYARELMDDFMSADTENRSYFDRDVVRKRRVDDSFRAAYTAGYKELRSSAQTVRLWIDESLAAGLDDLIGNGFFFLNPSLALPPVEGGLEQNANGLSTDAEDKFNNLQAAWSVCPKFDAIIVDWAKGEGVYYPEFDVRPILTKEEAEKIVLEKGRLPKPPVRFR